MNEFYNCPLNFGVDYNSWGEYGIGIIPSIPYQIYFDDDLGDSNKKDDDNVPGDSGKIYVKDGVLFIPNSFHAQFKPENELYIYDETVTYQDSTLGLVND
jgi:hypothetical protein